MITIVLAEDHETVREGLRLLLNAQPDMRVVGEASDGEAAVDAATQLKPDVIVLDVTMPVMNGLAAAKRLRVSVPASAILAFTRHDDPAYVTELMLTGASGYVLKQSPSLEFLRAIRAVADGERYLDPALSQVPTEKIPRGRSGVPNVTDRERQVLRQMAMGHSNKEIADTMSISIKTVEVHKANAMRKLDLRGRTDVVRYASLHGWLKDL